MLLFDSVLCPCSELLGTEDRWPWLLGFSGATALLQLITLPFLPESPKYLLLDRGDRQGCEKGKHLGEGILTGNGLPKERYLTKNVLDAISVFIIILTIIIVISDSAVYLIGL